jgi:hypothetical protein
VSWSKGANDKMKKNRNQDRQRFIRYYKQVTGATDLNMKEVAKFAVKMGWTLPSPKDPLDVLATQFSNAARQEVRRDKQTGKPYRVYHALKETRKGEQLAFWIDIDDKPPRKRMHKSLMMRREQMVGDGLQMTLDADHWNIICPNEEPIEIPLDFTEDVLWRKNSPDESEGESLASVVRHK